MEQNCCLLADSCMSLHTRGDSCDRRHAQSGEQPPHQDAPGALSSQWHTLHPVGISRPILVILDQLSRILWRSVQVVCGPYSLTSYLPNHVSLYGHSSLFIHSPAKGPWAVSTRQRLWINHCKPSCYVELLWLCNNYLGMELMGHA